MSKLEELKKKVENIKPGIGTGLPTGDYVKRQITIKIRLPMLQSQYNADKNKLLSTDEYEKDKKTSFYLRQI